MRVGYEIEVYAVNKAREVQNMNLTRCNKTCHRAVPDKMPDKRTQVHDRILTPVLGFYRNSNTFLFRQPGIIYISFRHSGYSPTK